MPPSPPRPPQRNTGTVRRAELAEAIDRVLNRGAVLRGDVVISVADIDLLFLDLRVVLSSVDTARKSIRGEPLGDAPDGSDSAATPPDDDSG